MRLDVPRESLGRCAGDDGQELSHLRRVWNNGQPAQLPDDGWQRVRGCVALTVFLCLRRFDVGAADDRAHSLLRERKGSSDAAPNSAPRPKKRENVNFWVSPPL